MVQTTNYKRNEGINQHVTLSASKQILVSNNLQCLSIIFNESHGLIFENTKVTKINKKKQKKTKICKSSHKKLIEHRIFFSLQVKRIPRKSNNIFKKNK